MRLTRQKRAGAGTELNIAAMIDVVFQLLIFFMCTSSFGKVENDLAARATQPGPSAQRARADFPPVRINLIAGDPVRIFCDRQECAAFSHLLSELEARKAAAAPQELTVIIAGDRDVPFDEMVAALDTCYLAGLETVAFSTADAR